MPVVPSDLHVSALQAPEVISMFCVSAYLLARAPTGSSAHVCARLLVRAHPHFF